MFLCQLNDFPMASFSFTTPVEKNINHTNKILNQLIEYPFSLI